MTASFSLYGLKKTMKQLTNNMFSGKCTYPDKENKLMSKVIL